MIPEIKTLLLATTPINELRGTIPIALKVFNLPLWKAFLFAYCGNMLPIFALLWFWPNLAQVLARKSKILNRLFNWIFERTKKKFYRQHALYGNLALVLFVAIPLPITGAWTGSVAAFLFGIPYKKSLGLIALGVLVAGIIVTTLTLGIESVFNIIMLNLKMKGSCSCL